MAEAKPTNLSEEDPTHMCTHCSFRGIDTLAGTFCPLCSEYLCDSCEVVHRSSKGSRDHELKPFEESQRLSIKQKSLISSIMVCDNHRTETLTMFCVNHSIAVCNVCNSMQHRNCNTKALKLISKDAKKDMIQCTEKVKTLLSESEGLKLSRAEEKTIIENCSKNCIQEVDKIKEEIIAFAEKLAQDMKQKISKAKNKLLVGIESDIGAMVDIRKRMEQFRSSFETLGQDFEDVTFVLMLKEKGNIESWIEMKDELLKHGKQVTLEFKQSDQLVTLLSEINSMGRIKVKEKKGENKFSFKAISSTTNKKVIDAGTTSVGGCVLMPDGKLVLCDWDNKSLKVFTPDFKLINGYTIESPVWDVAVVSKNEVIVTTPELKSLQCLILSNPIEKGKYIPVGMKCWGIDCKNKRLYVSCRDGNEQGGVVKVLTKDGVTVNTFEISQGYPIYLAVNSSEDRILISLLTVGVVCIDNSGNTLFTYSDRQLKSSRGVCFDSYDNFMVCGESINNIHVVNSDGTQHRILLTKDDGLNSPLCLAYRPSDNTLFVGEWKSPALLTFTIK